jgi:hypothetical protein
MSKSSPRPTKHSLLRITLMVSMLIITVALLWVVLAQYRLKMRVAELVQAAPPCPTLVMQAMRCSDPMGDKSDFLPSGRKVYLSRLLIRAQHGTSRLEWWRLAGNDFSVAWLLNNDERDALSCAIAPNGQGIVAYANTVLDRPLADATPLDQVFVACAFDQPRHINADVHYAKAQQWLDTHLTSGAVN